MNGEVDRPDPEDDPFACSRCGHYLNSAKRVTGEEYCDSCQREMGVRSPMRRCIECGTEGPGEQMEAIDVSPPGEYYPEFEFLCRSCAGGEKA